jgi:hypothetical protein
LIDSDYIRGILDSDTPTIYLAEIEGSVLSAALLREIAGAGVDVVVELENGFSFTALQLLGRGFNNNNSLDLYHIGSNGRATKVSNSNLTRANGGITVRIDRASFYVLSEESLIEEVEEDTDPTQEESAPAVPATPFDDPNPQTAIVPSGASLVIVSGVVVVVARFRRKKK